MLIQGVVDRIGVRIHIQTTVRWIGPIVARTGSVCFQTPVAVRKAMRVLQSSGGLLLNELRVKRNLRVI